MKYSYLITLKPLEPFFFGGEFTFGADESRQETSRYSATSTEFPQQTALLGMLRKTLLIQNGHLTMHKKGEWVDSTGRGTQSKNYDNAKALVGTDAFSYEKAIDLGIIDSLSPLFIKDKSNNFFIANAKDRDFEIKEIEGKVSIGNGQHKAFVFEGYDAKESNHKGYISTSKDLKDFSDFFKEVETVGIKKSQSGESEEDAFFRKKSHVPKDGESFAFIATFSQEIEWEKQSLVSLGADQSSFILKIEAYDHEFKTVFNGVHEAKKSSRIVLASQTLLSQEAYALCFFVLGERKPYRQLVNAKKGTKSKRYYLLEKGSVLYTEELEKLEKMLNQKHLRAIGINHYFTIKGKK
ncbi:MAG: CRISPR-associated RAMP Cmr3 [uncultured Sulfurovum sp.]|uniref:CRISPR-associated RAMP Cmr3 n=1 Tax=uncultured Sulfurovum sp. TaxID=269237 RepID=A0A6S6SCS8_9BACT|nr:MAG: CRISPR-associated RAMP Cmr3 [uncultured Sulfurovum sp.]